MEEIPTIIRNKREKINEKKKRKGPIEEAMKFYILVKEKKKTTLAIREAES